MIKPRLDTLLERVDSHYAVVLVAAKRARQINSYYHNLGEGPFGRNDFEGFRTKRVYSLPAKSRAFDRLIEDERVLDVAGALLGPNFRRTVVLVTEHTEEGAAGLVLNRPSPVDVAAAVPQLEPVVDDGDPVWVGGPVQPEAVLVLGEFLDPDDAAVPLFGALGFPSLADPDEIVPATTRRRVFAGYAGWGVGQLEAEVEDEDWILEPALPDDAFTDDPEELWRDVLRRKGGIYELVARIPEDPSVN